MNPLPPVTNDFAISRCPADFASILPGERCGMKADFFADDPNGFRVKEMVAPAGGRERQGVFRISQKKQKGDEDRDRTRPVPAQRRELLETSGVSSAVQKKVQRFAQKIAAGAMTQGAAEQCLDREVAANSFEVIWSLSRLFAKRYAQQDLRQVETGKKGGDRLDEPGIAVDIARQLRRFIED